MDKQVTGNAAVTALHEALEMDVEFALARGGRRAALEARTEAKLVELEIAQNGGLNRIVWDVYGEIWAHCMNGAIVKVEC